MSVNRTLFLRTQFVVFQRTANARVHSSSSKNSASGTGRKRQKPAAACIMTGVEVIEKPKTAAAVSSLTKKTGGNGGGSGGGESGGEEGVELVGSAGTLSLPHMRFCCPEVRERGASM